MERLKHRLAPARSGKTITIRSRRRQEETGAYDGGGDPGAHGAWAGTRQWQAAGSA
jgi:hypothetical protein